MKNKKYEIECQRSNVTPKQFFEYCRKRCELQNLDIESWVSFEDWVSPISKEEYHRTDHKDWETPQTEIIKFMPYDFQMYLQNTYDFIMEFEFDTEIKGHGYLYAIEFER